MKEYSEVEYLKLSGIQHYVYCQKQWALIHIQQMWADNSLTMTGNQIHERVHDFSIHEIRDGTIRTRALKISSNTLGVTGECDLVEFIPDPNGISIKNQKERYRILPVEYKRGTPKKGDEDIIQVTAQVICLEEMFGTQIHEAAIYYAQTRHRYKFDIPDSLKEECRMKFKEMHAYFERGHIPKVKYSAKCKNCSLLDICNPKMSKSASSYLQQKLEELYEEA
ncbi:CRISPR-associated protein Cas4 [Ileibacterium valens]|uniref:CRISPR-associated protein Cas4 n=1 Tax=Ileibacterium valens TaxID=1862668 RepID=UPI00259BC5D5|nr:CRISPR-associated protein Cas4 [Ileibacterium valens]